MMKRLIICWRRIYLDVNQICCVLLSFAWCVRVFVCFGQHAFYFICYCNYAWIMTLFYNVIMIIQCTVKMIILYTISLVEMHKIGPEWRIRPKKWIKELNQKNTIRSRSNRFRVSLWSRLLLNFMFGSILYIFWGNRVWTEKFKNITTFVYSKDVQITYKLRTTRFIYWQKANSMIYNFIIYIKMKFGGYNDWK